MITNLQCVFKYLSFLEKVMLFFNDISARFESFYSFLREFHDGFCKEIGKIKEQTSLGVLH